jgi:hypothetical protein
LPLPWAISESRTASSKHGAFTLCACNRLLTRAAQYEAVDRAATVRERQNMNMVWV